MMRLIKVTAINGPLVIWWGSAGEIEAFHGPMVQSQSFREPMPLDYELYRCFSVLFWDRMVEGAGVGFLPSPMWKAEIG